MTILNNTTNKTQRVIVGMSGGVDSSVAAQRLIEDGYQVEGLFMKNWEQDDDKDYCAAADDLKDAQQVCDKLGIKLHSVNFADQYWDRVFKNFLDEYGAGRTPNPDILCNKEIKFKAFLDYALQLGADFIATGHYVQRGESKNSYQLLKGLDDNKDQSYFLYTLTQQQLKHSLFPVGDIEKPEVRKLAEKSDFITHNKKDSTGICFIGERKFKDFLQRFIPAQPGEIKTLEGQTVGKHHGLMYYTLGQRKGLGIGGVKNATEEPWFSVKKDLEKNILYVAQGDDSALYHTHLDASQLCWVSGITPELPYSCKAKVRYRQDDQPCIIQSFENNSITVSFEKAQRAITPGQSVVFYQGNICLGGGVIDNMYNNIKD
ncbi:MAG: tRNA 2-thiouridine(34) synthase MnmA [endosymbiont of Galathealinum brachiosum]|uniref:tRNA-specific 2-thiouridylase MnmA n=1 Tax=endosymbiont of Galathealinum brachiosum TaxID=2200906 RepID=A0A370DGC8_9GAMM|nr:MAG: tRNA 2-thiouridine(34) synthase MnmA [endosymbiont of Galathealinum brachiosum]